MAERDVRDGAGLTAVLELEPGLEQAQDVKFDLESVINSRPSERSAPSFCRRCAARELHRRPSGKYTSHSIQPVFGSHGSRRNVRGSGTMIMSPAPAVGRGEARAWREHRNDGSVRGVLEQQRGRDRTRSSTHRQRPGSSALPRRIPCRSGKDNRMS